jgi:hypothetical protein
MCPACIATAALIAIGATGAGGLTVFAVSTFTRKQAASTIPAASKTKEDRHG